MKKQRNSTCSKLSKNHTPTLGYILGFQKIESSKTPIVIHHTRREGHTTLNRTIKPCIGCSSEWRNKEILVARNWTEIELWQHIAAVDSRWQQVTAGDSRWQQVTAGDSRWQQVTAGDSRWQQVTAGDSRWQHMTAGDSRWQQVTAGDSRWQQVTAGDSRWQQVTAGDSRWQQVTAGDSRWQQVTGWRFQDSKFYTPHT